MGTGTFLAPFLPEPPQGWAEGGDDGVEFEVVSCRGEGQERALSQACPMALPRRRQVPQRPSSLTGD